MRLNNHFKENLPNGQTLSDWLMLTLNLRVGVVLDFFVVSILVEFHYVYKRFRLTVNSFHITVEHQ